MSEVLMSEVQRMVNTQAVFRPLSQSAQSKTSIEYVAGQIELSLIEYIKQNQLSLAVVFIAVILMYFPQIILPMVVKNLLALMILTISTGLVYLGYRRQHHRFTHGQICLGKVLSVQPNRIAVLGQLNRDTDSSYPVIKITGFSTRNIGWRSLKVGDFAPMIASMESCDQPYCDHFHNFHPILLEPYAKNQQQLLPLLKSFNSEDFELFDYYLHSIPTVTKPGLYKVMVDSNWKAD